MRICKDDQVQIISGKDKGKIGKVLRVDLKMGRLVVEKVNVVKRHTKPTQKSPQGGIVEKEKSIHYSNAMLFCPKCNKGVRFGSKIGEATSKSKSKSSKDKDVSVTTKSRVCRSCDSVLDS